MDPIKRWIALGILWLLSAGPAVAAQLETVAVVQAELPRVYQLDGVAEAINRSTVSAQATGQVVEVNFDVDDLVHEGDVLVRIDDTQQQAAVRQAAANLQAAVAQRRDAAKEYQRIEGVFAKQAVSRAEMDRATTALEQARAAEQAAEAALQQAREQLAYYEVTAPYNGIVIERLIEVGETAQPGKRLMSGLSLDAMRISVDVPQNLVKSIRAERKAQARIDDEWIAAREVTVFPVADPRSGTFEVRLLLPPGVEGVFPGMYLKVGFVVGSQAGLVVPRSAIVLRSEVVGVYVVDDQGKVFLRHIRLGSPAGPDRVTVLSGLDQGEQVAIDPVAAVILLKQQRTAQVADE